MGLTVVVQSLEGYLGKKGIASLEALLKAEGLFLPTMPEFITEWDGDAFGYSGLHALRRLAAYLALNGALPPPTTKDATDDPHVEDYYVEYDERTSASAAMPFEHLMVHSDAEGVYLPIAFPKVLFAEDDVIPGGMVGSIPQLLLELETIAHALDLPAGLSFEDEAVFEAAEAQGDGEGWRRYGVEVYHLLLLREAGRRALAQGAAVVFM